MFCKRPCCLFIQTCVAGLVMLLGLIMYISVFKAEVGSKLRQRSQLEPPVFTYRYGYSFLLYVGGFVSTQIAGISGVFLFIYRMQHEWGKKYLDDLRKGKVQTPPPTTITYLPLDHNLYYPCRRHPQVTMPIDFF